MNSYFKFTFPQHYLLLTNYTVATNKNWASNLNFPRSWKLEGRVRGKWVFLGQIDESNLINVRWQTYSVDRIVPVTSLLFTLIGTSTTNVYYHFCVHKLDFFGSLISKNVRNMLLFGCSVKSTKRKNISFVIAIIICLWC